MAAYWRDATMRTKLYVLNFILFALATNAMAQGITVSSKLPPDYFGANGAPFAEKPVSQSDICLEFSSGVFACGWGSTGFNKKPGPDGRDYSREFDAIVGYSGGVKRLWYVVDGQYYAVAGIDVANGNIKAGFGPWFVHFQGYTPVRSGGPRQGLISSTGLAREFNIIGRLRGNAEALVKYDTGAFGFDNGWLGQAELGFTYALNGRTKLLLEVHYSNPLEKLSDIRTEHIHIVPGVSVKLK